MDLELSDEQSLIVDTVRKFVRNEIVPLEADMDPDASDLDEENHERLASEVKRMGFYGLDIPPEYGGPDIDIRPNPLNAGRVAFFSGANPPSSVTRKITIRNVGTRPAVPVRVEL